MIRKDQYGDPIDLNRLVPIAHCAPEASEIDEILGGDWYEVDGILCADLDSLPAAIREFLEIEGCLEDCGVDTKWAHPLYIASCLHRWTLEDGFYHA